MRLEFKPETTQVQHTRIYLFGFYYWLYIYFGCGYFAAIASETR